MMRAKQIQIDIDESEADTDRHHDESEADTDLLRPVVAALSFTTLNYVIN